MIYKTISKQKRVNNIKKLLRKIFKENIYVRYYFGYTYYKKGELEKSLENVRQILKIKPKYSYGINLLMSIGITKNDDAIINEALCLYNKKGKLKDPEILKKVVGLVAIGKYDEAKKTVENVNRKKYKKDIIRIRSDIASNKRQYEKALRILKEIGPLKKNEDPYILSRIGRYLIETGNKAEAKYFLKKAKCKGIRVVSDYVDNLIEEHYS